LAPQTRLELMLFRLTADRAIWAYFVAFRC
jgi:hypothetical protein